VWYTSGWRGSGHKFCFPLDLFETNDATSFQIFVTIGGGNVTVVVCCPLSLTSGIFLGTYVGKVGESVRAEWEIVSGWTLVVCLWGYFPFLSVSCSQKMLSLARWCGVADRNWRECIAVCHHCHFVITFYKS
jgi:hypothetical protein